MAEFFLKRNLSAILLLILAALLCCACRTTACADAEMCRAVIGADLSDEQVEQVYGYFGFPRFSVPELILTSDEEHAAMDGYLDNAILGTKAISCVYLELLPQGSGLNVRLENISWCSPEMYMSAMQTAGIEDANLIVAAPFPVTGSAAMAGVYKAWEDMTGKGLDARAEDAGKQELSVTGSLAESIGAGDSSGIVSELKQMLDETSRMTDDEIRSAIRAIAGSHSVRLTDAQVEQLLDLCRTLEKLDPNKLKERAESVQQTVQKVSEAKDQALSFLDGIKRILAAISSFFERLSGIFSTAGNAPARGMIK